MTNSNLLTTLNPRTWRTQATHDRYVRERAVDLKKESYCPLCEAETITEFNHWRIIDNKYPYDAVAKTHHMIVPLRHCVERELSDSELQELLELKSAELNQRYGFIFEALPGAKSIPGHHHLHLMETKTVS